MASSSLFREVMKYNVEQGKDGGVGKLAEGTSYQGYCVAEYIWLDADGNTRCKSKTITAKPQDPDDCGIWMYNGSSTGQADGTDSDVYLVPRAVFDDPFRGEPNVMVLCEAILATMEPAAGNYRALCVEYCDRYATSDPWFSMEQEYTLMKVDADSMGKHSATPYGFNQDGSEPAPQGSYYCAVGPQNIPKNMRQFMEDHYAYCLAAGVKITGTNAERMPGQGEFQIGPCRGVEIGDHVTMARHLLHIVAEKYGFSVSLDPKPVQGDWSGAGCHTNFSTKQMRTDGGLMVIEKVCRAFARRVGEHIQCYGEGNAQRLTGKNETCDINTFKFGVGSRAVAIRIPRNVGVTGKGYFEDRRPAANCDPYRVAYIMMNTTGEVLLQMARTQAASGN